MIDEAKAACHLKLVAAFKASPPDAECAAAADDAIEEYVAARIAELGIFIGSGKALKVYAWVGEDDLGRDPGEEGMKQGFRPGMGVVPLAGVYLERMEDAAIVKSLQMQCNQFGKPMRLIECIEVRTVKTITKE